MNQLSELDPGMEQNLRDLAKIRNLVVHGFEPATRDNAKAALSAVTTLMTQLEV